MSGGKRKSVSLEQASNNDARPSKKGGGKVRVEDTFNPLPEVSQEPCNDRAPKEASCGILPTNLECTSKFTGKLVNDLLFVEVCAGSARLTRAARDAGFNGIAIDHTNQRSDGMDICIFELEDSTQVRDLCNFLEEQADNIAAVWVAPSCGTASKARERRLPKLQRLGIPVPVPLRSTSQPDQMDGLEGTDKIKVERANMLYDAVEDIARSSCRAGIFTSIENPANSHYWNTSPMQRLMNEFGNRYVTFHNCCHGGSGDKLTSIWVNDDWLDSLEARCDGSHPHKSWKVTMTDSAVHFPQCSTSVDNVLSRKYVQEVLQCATRGFGPCWPFMWLAILFSMSLSSMFRKGSICLVSCCDVFRKMSC